MKWRVIITDTESLTGVAPVCGDPAHDPAQHDDDPDGTQVFDCCPRPHIEVWSEAGAQIVAGQLSLHEAESCS